MAHDAALTHVMRERDRLKGDLERLSLSIAVSRQESLMQSLRVRQQRVREAMENTKDERILRMRRSQLTNLETRVMAKVEEIQANRRQRERRGTRRRIR